MKSEGLKGAGVVGGGGCSDGLQQFICFVKQACTAETRLRRLYAPVRF